MKKTVEKDLDLLEVLKIMQPNSSTNVLRKMLTNQRISVDEVIIHRAKHLVLKGQIVEILPKPKISLEEARETSAKTHNIDVLFEDDSILVVDKPAGLLSVATDRLEQDTLHNRCVEYCRSEKRNGWCFIVHRLDKATSGIMIFAKTESAKRDLQEQFAERQVHRHYVALVEGNAQSGQADHHLVEDKNLRVFVSEKKTKTSKRAITTWAIIALGENQTLLYVVIETGRRHQIRVALAESGTPVVGDKMHGATTNLHGRICLHAVALEFLHPVTDEPVRFESEFNPAWRHGLKNP
ncbi:MAG: Ribosomal large subunit pseudouridine synthase A [Candidatus Poseidoniaceae archaeon]|nr:MAG: Ribosomal large subunit pseudouridine synthase A [Candidatus Poseidoniaceae archaeon]